MDFDESIAPFCIFIVDLARLPLPMVLWYSWLFGFAALPFQQNVNPGHGQEQQQMPQRWPSA